MKLSDVQSEKKQRIICHPGISVSTFSLSPSKECIFSFTPTCTFMQHNQPFMHFRGVRCHTNDMFLFLPFEGQFKLSPRCWICISDAEMCARECSKWIQWRSAGISFLKTDFFFPLLKYKLPCLFKAEVWGVLISTSSLKPFHVPMNVKCYQDYTLDTLKEWAEELISAVYCSFQGILTMLI